MSKPTLDLFALGVFLSAQARALAHPHFTTCPRPRDYVVRPIGQRDGEPTDGEIDEMMRDLEREQAQEMNEAVAADERNHAQPYNIHDN